ncbi:MAG TPA: glycogen debranching protein GlgX, partial [Acidimicrobiia bacterium]|nr:glycogen debranching protein GlgX [Acidimicrobiia bacterium]
MTDHFRLRPGATNHGGGTIFTVRAPHADKAELCLFEGAIETRHEMVASAAHFSIHVPGVVAGQRYGFRLHGNWDPSAGIFTNPAKLLLDPYALRIEGDLRANPALVIHRPRLEDLPDLRDNAAFVPRSVVADTSFDWDSDELPDTPWEESLIYETHVRGMTMRHPSLPPELRGTYAGLATAPILEHLLALGVTAVELLPVQFSITEPWLSRRGLSNYWGYSSIGFFAPNPCYASSTDPVSEFKAMVRALHIAGLEVILDVVYNHTAEGNHLGPTLSFRGFDNPGFYRLDPADRRRYLDWTGTGNSVDQTLPWALEVTLDSLRYWAQEMHIDGFRFDLATSLGRREEQFDPTAPLFEAIANDPVLSRLKLIAEPWDLGPHGYQLGSFPPDWREWNGKFRDDVRDFWRNGDSTVASLARRLSGSPDLFGGRSPTTSINFITAHDGFTLHDLVSYNHKHNQANREHNRDGEGHNRSWNSGSEGPTDEADVLARRRTRAESLLATLFLARGVPMLLGGDELGRTQSGNNNAYGQDNVTSWFDWDELDWERTAFAQRLAALRRQHPVLHRPAWLSGPPHDDGVADVMWFRPDGHPMAESD